MSLRRKADDLRMEQSYMKDERIMNAIRTLPDCDDVVKQKHYSVIDFKGTKAYLEMKSRRIRHNQYKTCVIGVNKIDEFRRNNLRNYVCWLYEDGLYYLPIDLDNWNYNTFMMRTQRDCGVEISPVYEIPYQHLIKLEY